MNVKVIKKNNENIAVLSGDSMIISNAQDALDLAATAWYEYKCGKIIISKENITEDFFNLRTGVAGEIMEKIYKLWDFSGHCRGL